VTEAKLAAALAPHGLGVLGIAPPRGADLPADILCIVLVGPARPGFWPGLRAQPEFRDGAPDPLDRWSRRVLDDLAGRLDAISLYPFGGPPFQPFMAWATASNRAWHSPSGILVHDNHGLMVSFRGALGMRAALPIAPPRLTLSKLRGSALPASLPGAGPVPRPGGCGGLPGHPVRPCRGGLHGGGLSCAAGMPA